MNKNKLGIRLVCYFAGLFIMTMGIAISVKSNLGVSPLSSVPYTMTCIWGIEMGKATILFHMALVVIQILLLRRQFQWKNLLQVLIGVVFGYFTTFCNSLMADLPDPGNIVIRLCMILVSTLLIAVGIFFYVPADILPLAGEGCIQAISTVSGKPFHKIKVIFDISCVCLSLISCLLLLGRLGSVGIGTVIVALLVGNILGVLNKHFGNWRDRLLGVKNIKEES